jgi:hypothetical protein
MTVGGNEQNNDDATTFAASAQWQRQPHESER